MIIRPLAASFQLISQPQHAALAARIMRHWQPEHFPESARKASILNAIAQHDNGYAEIDEELVVDEATGRLLDFIDLPDALKRETSLRGIELLASDPYAAALVAQHRLHVYRRYAGHPEWSAFFARVTTAREAYLLAAGSVSLDELLHDYTFVRAGDLASLAFCNNWTEVDSDGCGYAMRLKETSLFIIPDPFGARTVEIEIDAREIAHQSFDSAVDAQRVVASAPVVTLKGLVSGVAA